MIREHVGPFLDWMESDEFIEGFPESPKVETNGHDEEEAIELAEEVSILGFYSA